MLHGHGADAWNLTSTSLDSNQILTFFHLIQLLTLAMKPPLHGPIYIPFSKHHCFQLLACGSLLSCTAALYPDCTVTAARGYPTTAAAALSCHACTAGDATSDAAQLLLHQPCLTAAATAPASGHAAATLQQPLLILAQPCCSQLSRWQLLLLVASHCG